MGGDKRGGAPEGAPFPDLGGLLAYRDDFVVLLQPDGAACGALEQVFRVTVGMHVDLDTFFAVTFGAMHGVFSCRMVLGTIYYIERQKEVQVDFLQKNVVKQLFTCSVKRGW